jgi:hypothetical protein
MSVRHPWARLREDRAASLGRHRALPTVTENRMPASPAASLPLLSEREAVRLGAPYSVPGEPKVQCKLCGIFSPVSEMSQIPELGWGPRCYDTDACTKRQMDKEYPNPLPAPEVPALPMPAEPLEPLPEQEPIPVLPPAQEAALERFEQAHEAEGSETRAKDKEPPDAAAEPPADTTQPAPAADEDAPEATAEGEPQP